MPNTVAGELMNEPPKRHRRSDAETLDALIDLVSDVELTDAEVDTELRELGYDPDELGRHYKEVAQKALADVARRMGA